jgi:hypothetical protein
LDPKTNGPDSHATEPGLFFASGIASSSAARKGRLRACGEIDTDEVTRGYQRPSTMLTSTAWLEGWGKLWAMPPLLGAMLDHLLHHGYLLKCCPWNWRTNTDSNLPNWSSIWPNSKCHSVEGFSAMLCDSSRREATWYDLHDLTAALRELRKAVELDPFRRHRNRIKQSDPSTTCRVSSSYFRASASP